MEWKVHLRSLEQSKQWDEAIAFMEKVILDNPQDKEAYIFMNFLLMNLLVEEYHDESKHDYYEHLTKKYFDASYAKYNNDAEYLFFTALTAVMSEWYFGIDVQDYDEMFAKAHALEPENPIYQYNSFISLQPKLPHERQEAESYARMVLSPDSPIQQTLATKGAVGEYLLNILIGTSKEVLGLESYTWKKYLRALEQEKKWDDAIAFMEQTIQRYPNNKDTYIFMNFLLMNLLVEEDHDKSKHDYYEHLAKKYFDESYTKFSSDAEYLFFTALTAVMSEWHFGIDVKDYDEMFLKAKSLAPDNLLYQYAYYLNPDSTVTRQAAQSYAQMALDENSPIKQELKTKGAIGEYFFEILTNKSKRTLGFIP